MKIFSALLGQIDGVFGKAYLLAGLLPAIVLVFCGNWYLSGQAVSSLIDGLVTSTQAADPGFGAFTAAALLSLAMGLVFFAARSWLLDILQAMPGRRMRWINELLVHRQLRKRSAAKLDEDRQDHDSTVVEWVDPGKRNFDVPASLPWFIDEPSQADMEFLSRKACDVFAVMRERAHDTPYACQHRMVLEGWRALYAYARSHHASIECRQQFDRWRAEFAKKNAWRILQAVQDHVHRTWVDSTRSRDNSPIEDKWVGPTQLGTRAAALDDYAQERYGIDTSMMLSRLAGVMSTEEKEGLSNSRLSVETLVNLSVAAACIALLVVAQSIGPCFAAVSDGSLARPDWRGAAFLAAGILTSVVLYRGALHAFGGMAEKTMRAIDLNRLALLKKMGFVMPASMGAERELWGQIGDFLDPGRPTFPTPDPPLREPS